MFSPEPQEEGNDKEFFHQQSKKNEDQKESCEGLITEDELHRAILSFKKGKIPGLDVISIEMYKCFMNICLNVSIFNEKGMHAKQDSNGKYKDPIQLKIWRPLTLQGYD